MVEGQDKYSFFMEDISVKDENRGTERMKC